MRPKLLLFFILFFPSLAGISQTSIKDKISYDGYYRTLPDTLNPFSYYLRFYPDGTVIGYSTAGNPNNLVSWFKKDHKSPSKGQYVLKDSTISFSLKSEEGTVLYDGIFLPDNRIFFSVKSLINKYQGKEEYFFLKMDGLK
ncbi:MAG TPA: hypothetical protein VGQ09_05415 [Chitinophagaceae bacterium]|jgi:hypothetical protein|nr:hypothetical protein [Chitinophagaceae bacterium]